VGATISSFQNKVFLGFCKSMLEKRAFLGDMVRGVFGYHNLNDISKETGIPKGKLANFYHGLGVPNQMLYDKKNVINDAKAFFAKSDAYDQARDRSGLLKTKPGSQEEYDVMAKHKKELDQKLQDVLNVQDALMFKYRKIKS